MASIAIDPSDIGSGAPRAGADRTASRGLTPKRVVAWAALGIGVVALGLFAAYRSLPAVMPQLAGFASLVEPPRPRRTDIRIGPIPDMPEIRNGVPEIVVPRPVRMIQTPTASQIAEVPRPAPPAPAEVASVGPSIPTVAAPVVAADKAVAAAVPPVASVAMAPDPVATAGTAASELRPLSPVRDTPETGSLAAAPLPAILVPATAPASRLVPLPPPAPARMARAPEMAAAARPAKPVPRTTLAQAGRVPSAEAPKPADAAAAEDDRVEVLGVKFPTVRDVGNAIASFGETVMNLPKAF